MSAGPAPRNGIAGMRSASARAGVMRGDWLMNVNSGLATPAELIEHAVTEAGRPLRRIGLRQVIAAQPRVSLIAADADLRRVLVELGGGSFDVRSMTVGWLVDPRSRGRRFAAWMRVTSAPADCPPWSAFPWAADPAMCA